MASLFGWEIKRQQNNEPMSFAPEQKDDGAVLVEATGGAYGTYVDMGGAVRTESELVTKYREISLHPEVKSAIDDIVNEAIVDEGNDKAVVEIILDKVEVSDNIKKMIEEEFEEILKLYEFNQSSYDVFKRWYIDGRMYYHVIIDEKNPREGIQELRYIDPRYIRKIRENKKKKVGNTNLTVSETKQEYFMYNERGFSREPTGSPVSQYNGSQQGIRIAADSIVHVTSGLTNANNDIVLSYLHEAIKPLNMLSSLEDSLVIYRLSRAPERRVFYIDVGNLPKVKADQYMRDLMTKFKNKIVYDSTSGEIRDDRKFMSMMEDFWLPRRDGKGTEIDVLPGGQNLGSIEDVEYFQNKLYKALNVPVSRLDKESVFSLGRSSEISRDEIKFSKFIARLRHRFTMLLSKALGKQLILKGIITEEDWKVFEALIRYRFNEDNYYAELKEMEIYRERIELLAEMDMFAGKYYSHEFLRKNILRQTEEEIQEQDKLIKAEMNNPQYFPPVVDDTIPGNQSISSKPKPPANKNNK